jgi:hypothetical protein
MILLYEDLSIGIPARKSQAWAADIGPMGGPGQADLGPTI